MNNRKLLSVAVLAASFLHNNVMAESSSAYDDIPEFGGPNSVGVELKEENAPAKTDDFIKDLMPGWFEAKENVMKDHGLAYGINYSTLYMRANKSVGEDSAWGGMLQVPVSWTVLDDKNKGNTGTIIFKAENRHKIGTELAPQDLGLGTSGPNGQAGLGAASIVGTQFSDKDWFLTNLYWQHKMNGGKLNYVVGHIDNTDFMDIYGLINPQTAFMNFDFATNNTIGIPEQGFGAYGATTITDNFYIIAGLMDARARSDEPLQSVEDFFSKNEYFKHIEVGYVSSFERRYLDNIHVVYWESDEQSNDNGGVFEPSGSGWAFSAAHFFKDKYMPFFRYGESDGGGGALNEKLIAAGLGIYDRDSGELFGVGISRTTPSEKQFGPADDQTSAEVFYRFMLSKHLAITPDLQYIKNPALNPNDDSIWIAGIRARLTI
jgi:porin